MISQTERDQWHITQRIERIQESGYFGLYKRIHPQECLWQLKWQYGGNKNGQNKDIVKARNIAREFSQRYR